MNNKIITAIAVILGLALIAIALVYFTTPAASLPSFFPGFDLTTTKIHLKHGIASLLLGLAAFAYAWFNTKPKSAPSK